MLSGKIRKGRTEALPIRSPVQGYKHSSLQTISSNMTCLLSPTMFRKLQPSGEIFTELKEAAVSPGPVCTDVDIKAEQRQISEGQGTTVDLLIGLIKQETRLRSAKVVAYLPPQRASSVRPQERRGNLVFTKLCCSFSSQQKDSSTANF